MSKITRTILGHDIELELTDEEVAAIIREHEEKIVKEPGFRNDDGAAVWYMTIEDASNTIAEWFLDNRGDYFEYSYCYESGDVQPELVDEGDMDVFIVTSDCDAKGIGSTDDAVAICGRQCGGNITLAYLWRLDYTPSEMYRYFAEEICEAMCNSCGLKKSDHIYLKAGEIKEE